MSRITIEEYLQERGELTYRNVGTSMLPLLKQGRDLFTMKRKTNRRCCKFDVVLYKRPPKDYVLHRVIAVRPNGYVIRGDNCLEKEYGITDADILGVMTDFVHKGKSHSVNDFSYRAFVQIWCRYNALRALAYRGVTGLHGVVRWCLGVQYKENEHYAR